MADVDDIIDFVKSLRKGFDKDLFQSKLDELAYAVDTTGLEYDDFHTLFKVWLNLSLPITKWVNMGSCLAPPNVVEKHTVQYALRWILVNLHDESSFSRLGFLLDWLTAAMECDCIDMTALDVGYDVFHSMLTFEVLAVHAAKLVYTLTKPVDVTRKKVLDLISNAKNREAQKSIYKPLQVLLGLFKSYKPECVPEDIPAIPIYTAFKKLNNNLLTRFKKTQDRRSSLSKHRQHLVWINPINSERGRNKKLEPLVPNVEFVNTGRQSADGGPNNFLDFSEPASVIQYSVQRSLSRPARLRALLCNVMGQTLLAIHPHSEQAFLAQDLAHLLRTCFLEVSPYSYVEEQDLLQKLATFQRTLVQGIPVITRFLAQFLPYWNEKDYFPEILELMEWVSADCPEDVQKISGRMTAVYLRAPPLEQCAIVRSLTIMYTNLVYSSTRSRQHFLSSAPPHTSYALVLPALAAAITNMCHKGLQVDPDDLRVLHMTLWSAHRCARAEHAYGARVGALPTPLALALPLVALSPVLIDSVAELMILYKRIMVSDNIGNEDHIKTISEYLYDMHNCLYKQRFLSGRHDGLVFKRMHPQLVDKLGSLMPDVNSKLSLHDHLAFAPYTYLNMMGVRQADNNTCGLVISSELPHLGLLMKKLFPDMGHTSYN